MQRVMIIGGPGSGKSTLALALGKKLGLPVTHIDRFQFTAGWLEVDPAKRDAHVCDVIASDSWIIDGNYSSTLKDRMDRADTLIWLDVPLWQRLWRVARRTWIYYGQNRPELPEGCPERFSPAFIHYIVTSSKRQREKAADRYATMSRRAQAFHLRSSRDVKTFLEQLS
ncbi:MAG: AAA family ATPase [Pseudomonadota bacterium]|nr:AAA family ATPase [Pseudomonadota bacterium]